MNELRDKIDGDLKAALRARDELRLSVLRMASAAIHNREIEKRTKTSSPDLTEDEVMGVLKTEIKKRKDAAEGFEKGGRADSAKKELEEARIIEAYLPAELADDEIERIVKDVIAETGALDIKMFGHVMGEAMKRICGRASGDRVSLAVKKILTK